MLLRESHLERKLETFSCRAKLHGLFGLIEKEFEGLYMENVSLTEKLELMTERMERESICTTSDRWGVHLPIFWQEGNPY
jgi:hypothetical protein